MHDLVPQKELGVFFSRRLALSTALGVVLALGASIYVDYWEECFPAWNLYGYSVLFALGWAVGMLAVYFIAHIPEPKFTWSTVFAASVPARPFRDLNFRTLLIFLGSWNFAVKLAAPFFTVYLLQRLRFGLFPVIGLTVLGQVTNLLFLPLWGRFADRFSAKSVIGVSGPLFLACVLAWTFTTLPEKHRLTGPLLLVIHVVMGMATAGVTLASNNIGLKLAPKGEAAAYLAVAVLVNSLAAGIAPIVGGLLADFYAAREFSLTIRWVSPVRDLAINTLDFRNWDFFFFFAFLIGLYSVHRLGKVREVGEVEEEVVIRALLTAASGRLRNMSTTAGLRQLIQFPLALVRDVRR